MNLVYGEVLEVLVEDGMRFARVRFAGAQQKIPLDLLADAAAGDTVLVCDGVAISKVEDEGKPQ